MKISRIELSRNWLFALTEDEQAVYENYDDSNFIPVVLPHDWQINQVRTRDAKGGGSQGFYPREHRGVYRLTFHAPQEWQSKSVQVLFDGVQRFSTIYLNGVQVGERPYGYVPFMCDLTDHIRFGQDNLLAVSVDNRHTDPSIHLAGGDRWYSGAGIHRKVWLMIDEPTHIVHDGISIVANPVLRGPSGDVPDVAGIRCDLAKVEINAEITGDCDDAVLHAEVVDPAGHCVWTAETKACKNTQFTFDLPKPALWTPDSPNLYTLTLVLWPGNDRHIVRFGVRSAVFDGEDGFLLNSVKTKLWGVNLHHDGGAVGSAVPVEVWERRLKALKPLGVNTIRAAHHPMPEEFYDLCDELGFLVVDEVYDKWCESRMYFDRLYEQWHLKDTEAMVRRDRNHPCVILWSVGNEVGHQYSELFYKCMKELCDYVRSIDPTRGLTVALIGFVLPHANDLTPMSRKLDMIMRYAEIADVFMGNYMEHFYEKMREYGMRKPIIGSEVRNYYRLDEKTLNSVQISNESPFAIAKKYDWVCGSLVWAGIDYLGEASFWPMRGWTGNLLDTTADWKLRAWYCAAQWKNEPVLKLCVYDESEPWDGARGAWGFPQVRAHWKYTCFEKMLHVAVMTNCDTVKLYQNSQTVRVGRLADFPDGMVHFWLPFIPGILRAEGYRGGMKVAEDILRSDHEAHTLRLEVDRTELPADGRSVAMIDLLLEDRYGKRYMLENRQVRVTCQGAPVKLRMDNGNAFDEAPFERDTALMDHGHLMIMVQSGVTAGKVDLNIAVDGFGMRCITLLLK